MSTNTLDLATTSDQPWSFEGFSPEHNGWVIPRPVNAHTHLRDPLTQPDIFQIVVPESAKLYHWVTAMPNLAANRIRTRSQAYDYLSYIRTAAQEVNPTFTSIVPFYVEPDFDLEELELGLKSKAFQCGKLYPKNGTTNSEYGVNFLDIESCWPIFKLMEKYKALLLIHGEVVRDDGGALIPDAFREFRAHAVIESILKTFPKLRVVFEHISSGRSVQKLTEWQQNGYRIEATIAPQYLLWTNTKLFEGGMNPEFFSIPILKDEGDRKAILEFMLDGGGMLGTDSAPHDVTSKVKMRCCAGGVFNEPVGLFVYFHLFRVHGGAGWFERFIEFACRKAPAFYGMPNASEDDLVVIREKPWTVPDVYKMKGARIIPMFAGETVPYLLEALNA